MNSSLKGGCPTAALAAFYPSHADFKEAADLHFISLFA